MEFKVKNAEDVEGQKDKIIKEKDVTDAIEESIDTYKEAYIKTVTEQLDEEMKTGGLSPYALCIEGQTPLYDQAAKLNIRANNLTTSINNLEKKIKSCYHKQRALELRKLSKAISKAMTEHEKKRDDYIILNNQINKAWDEIDALKQDCKSKGIQYKESPTLLANYGYSSPWSYSTYTVFGQTTITICVPGQQRNAYKDKIDLENQEISKLQNQKNIIDKEANTEESEA